MLRTRALASLLTLLIALGLSHPSRADDTNKTISNAGTIGFLALGALLPFAQDGDQGTHHFLRTVDSLVVSGGIAEGLKSLTRVRRPNSDSRDSFPSLHTTAAFAVATMQSQFHPSEAPLWFLGAAAIANSRVQLREHHWSDVIAGAALGFGTARIELSCHRGLLIAPFMTDEGGYGMMFSSRF